MLPPRPAPLADLSEGTPPTPPQLPALDGPRWLDARVEPPAVGRPDRRVEQIGALVTWRRMLVSGEAIELEVPAPLGAPPPEPAEVEAWLAIARARRAQAAAAREVPRQTGEEAPPPLEAAPAEGRVGALALPQDRGHRRPNGPGRAYRRPGRPLRMPTPAPRSDSEATARFPSSALEALLRHDALLEGRAVGGCRSSRPPPLRRHAGPTGAAEEEASTDPTVPRWALAPVRPDPTPEGTTSKARPLAAPRPRGQRLGIRAVAAVSFASGLAGALAGGALMLAVLASAPGLAAHPGPEGLCRPGSPAASPVASPGAEASPGPLVAGAAPGGAASGEAPRVEPSAAPAEPTVGPPARPAAPDLGAGLPDVIVLPVLFRQGSARPREPDRAALRSIAAAIVAHPELRLELVGHAAPGERGDPEARRRLGARRASKALELVRSFGPSRRRFSARAARPGEDVPPGASGDPATGRVVVLRVVRR